MPASNIGSYSQEARNNIDAMRPALICTDANQPMGQCQNMHVSTNCYYGYHNLKSSHTHHDDTDCEMVELEAFSDKRLPLNTITRKRSAEEDEYPQKKRLREEGMVPSTTNYNPCILRPTHNNPDISRCLMVHMI